MKIISRKEAKALGLKRYFTGEPCDRGHLCERDMHWNCVECRRENGIKSRLKHPQRCRELSNAARRRRLIAKAQARADRKRGTLCRGSNSCALAVRCLECKRIARNESVAKWQAKNYQRYRENIDRYRRDHPQWYRDYMRDWARKASDAQNALRAVGIDLDKCTAKAVVRELMKGAET